MITSFRKFINEGYSFDEDIDWNKDHKYPNNFKTIGEFQNWQDGYMRKIAKHEFGNITRIGDKFYNVEALSKIINGFVSFYGDYTEAIWQLNGYISTIDSLHKNGGDVYRLVYTDSIDDINKEDLGLSWTVDVDVIELLHSKDWRSMYGEGKKEAYVIKLKTEPKNITVSHVDISGNPEEKEINIINFNKTKIVSIKPLK